MYPVKEHRLKGNARLIGSLIIVLVSKTLTIFSCTLWDGMSAAAKRRQPNHFCWTVANVNWFSHSTCCINVLLKGGRNMESGMNAYERKVCLPLVEMMVCSSLKCLWNCDGRGIRTCAFSSGLEVQVSVDNSTSKQWMRNFSTYLWCSWQKQDNWIVHQKSSRTSSDAATTLRNEYLQAPVMFRSPLWRQARTCSAQATPSPWL